MGRVSGYGDALPKVFELLALHLFSETFLFALFLQYGVKEKDLIFF